MRQRYGMTPDRPGPLRGCWPRGVLWENGHVIGRTSIGRDDGYGKSSPSCDRPTRHDVRSRRRQVSRLRQRSQRHSETQTGLPVQNPESWSRVSGLAMLVLARIPSVSLRASHERSDASSSATYSGVRRIRPVELQLAGVARGLLIRPRSQSLGAAAAGDDSRSGTEEPLSPFLAADGDSGVVDDRRAYRADQDRGDGPGRRHRRHERCDHASQRVQQLGADGVGARIGESV